MELDTLLQNFGLNEKQIVIYTTLLQLGNANIQEIARKSKIKRTTAYSVLDTLIQRGLINFSQKGAHREYFAEDPKKLPSILEEENRKLEFKQKSLLSALPELSSIYNSKASKPKIRFYEGVEGLKQIYEETLLLKPDEEMFAFGQATLIHQFLGDQWVESYLSRRRDKKIFQRSLVEDSPAGIEHQKNDKNENRQTILIPQDKYPFISEINIFGNKISIVSFKELMGVVIESPDVAKTQKSIFELAWLGAKGIGK